MTGSADVVDVVVVGAGPSGAVVTKRLAEAGMSVVCLEQGDWPDREQYRGTESDFEVTAPKRWAAHPNVRPMLDCYHFWAGLSKFEDLDLIRPGEIHHVHFQDVPDIPRELLDNGTRDIPGTGVSPLVAILRKLAEKGYAGPLSVELFYPELQNGDPYEVAVRIRQKAEPVMRAAGVL